MKVGKLLVTHRAIHNALTGRVCREGLESLAPPGDTYARICRELDAALRSPAATAGEEAAAAPRSHRGDGGKAQRRPGGPRRRREEPDVFTALEDETASLLQSHLAEKAAAAGDAEEIEAGGLEAKFDDHDFLGWGLSFFSWWRGIIKHAWLPPPAEPEPVASTFRLGILADWGTDLYGAPVCARSLQKDAAGYQLFLHLGDVYYSGAPKEVAERFLALWPQRKGAFSRALNSNHEMYSGGHAYFGQTMVAMRSRFGSQGEGSPSLTGKRASDSRPSANLIPNTFSTTRIAFTS
jgi:hypothetical protein